MMNDEFRMMNDEGFGNVEFQIENVEWIQSIKKIFNSSFLILHSLILLLFMSFGLSAQEKIPSLYVGEFKVDEGLNIKPEKARNLVINSVNKNFKNMHTILDDELVRQLMKKVGDLQKSGCSDIECKKAMDQAIDWDEKIVGSVSRDGENITLDIKLYSMNKETYQAGVKNSQNETFKIFQLEYYADEMTKALLDSGYTVNHNNAPKTEIAKNKQKIETNTAISIMNYVLPGTQKIYNRDNTGYAIGSAWLVMVYGIVSNYSHYQSYRNAYSSLNRESILMPFLLNQTGNLTLNNALALSMVNHNEKASIHSQAHSKNGTISAFSLIAAVIWGYNYWTDRPEYSTAFHIPGTKIEVSASMGIDSSIGRTSYQPISTIGNNAIANIYLQYKF